jgi:hypothetical protein
MTKKDKAKLRMAFLFLIAEGKVTRDKYDAFDAIGNNFNDFNDYRRDLINSCLGIFDGNIISYSAKKRFNTIKAEILSIAKGNFDYYNSPSKTQLECFWMLISLAFNQKQLTQNKKAILKEICEAWEIKTAIAAEMMDTAETIIAIDDHKKWLSSLKVGGGLLSALIPFKKNSLVNNEAVNSEIDKNLEDLIKSVNFLIEDEAEPLDEEDEDEDEDEDEFEDEEEEDEDEYEDEDGEAPEPEEKPDKDWIEGEEEENKDDNNEEENEEEDDYDDDDSKDIWS